MRAPAGTQRGEVGLVRGQEGEVVGFVEHVSHHRSHGVVVADFDRDGLTDIFVANDAIRQFDTSCFSGEYVTGVQTGYLEALELRRSDSARTTRRVADLARRAS